MENFYFDFTKNKITLDNNQEIPLDQPKAFQVISDAWLRSGWDSKYVYGFTWLGRPVIQLPEDLLKIQEVIFTTKPDIIIETGVAHGGSLIFYSSLFESMGHGKVIGIDVEFREHNRKSIEDHFLSHRVDLIEGDSIEEGTINQVEKRLSVNDVVLVILDSNHSKHHVLSELNLYSKFVSLGSYIVVCDGIMAKMQGAPRTKLDWSWNNPLMAIEEFIKLNPNFEIHEPDYLFNEGQIMERVTYWPNAFLKRIS